MLHLEVYPGIIYESLFWGTLETQAKQTEITLLWTNALKKRRPRLIMASESFAPINGVCPPSKF
jgi:hypothetical protein